MGRLDMSDDTVEFRPPEPMAQVTLREMSWALDRLEDTDPDVLRALLRGLLYERDQASARIVRTLRSAAG